MPGDEIAPVDEVLAAEGEEVASVGALGGRGQSQEELGLEVVDEAPVGAGGGVVELVDDDVVEALRAEPSKVLGFSEGLDRGEEDIRLGRFLVADVEAESGLRADGAEGRERLSQDLLSVSDEEDAIRFELDGVERGEPRLSEAGRKHHQARGVSLDAGFLESFERFLLDRVGLGDGAGKLGFEVDGR